jgi:hypothetical protein
MYANPEIAATLWAGLWAGCLTCGGSANPPGLSAEIESVGDKITSGQIHRGPSAAGGHFRQKPCPPLGLVDPVFNQTGGCDIVARVANLMGGTQETGEFPIFGTEFGQHVQGLHELPIVVFETLISAKCRRWTEASFRRFCGRVPQSHRPWRIAARPVRRAANDNHFIRFQR